ncbi:MAG: class I SAM-dependent methyltransferase [Micromonosporaceae bacterium]
MAESVSFDRVAEVYDESRGGLARGRRMARDIAEWLVPGTVCEIGVGTGSVASGLTALGHHVVGVDISPAMLAQAYQRIGPRVVVGDALRLPFGDTTASNAVFVHVLHLVGDLAAAVVEAARVLRPGGRLLALHGIRDADPDELTRATAPVDRLRFARPDSYQAVRDAATAAGLAPVYGDWSAPVVTEETPARLADKYADRIFSWMWRVDDATWHREVEPVIAALRALPEPHRPRRQTFRVRVSVFDKPG